MSVGVTVSSRVLTVLPKDVAVRDGRHQHIHIACLPQQTRSRQTPHQGPCGAAESDTTQRRTHTHTHKHTEHTHTITHTPRRTIVHPPTHSHTHTFTPTQNHTQGEACCSEYHGSTGIQLHTKQSLDSDSNARYVIPLQPYTNDMTGSWNYPPGRHGKLTRHP